MLPRLICLGGLRQGEVFSMTSGEITIGRDKQNSLTLADPMASRHHCTIRRTGDGEIEVLDHGSRNGTFVNGIPVKSRRLDHGDRIRIGAQEFEMVLAEEAVSPPSAILLQNRLLETMPVVQLRQEDSAYLSPERIPEACPSPVRSGQYLKALLRLCSLIRTTGGLDGLARGVMEVLFDTIPGAEGALLMLDPESRTPSWSYGWRRDTGPAADVEVASDLAWRAVEQEVGMLRNVAGPCRRALLVAPLAGRDKPIGVVFMAGGDLPAVFDQEHLQLFTAIGRVAGLALDDARTVEQLRAENRRLRDEMDTGHGMVGESRAMQRVYQFIQRVAPADSTVLITGESGTGKELVARAIHRGSRRSEGAFVGINCAALTASLIESELFGHEKGAFTGALSRKPGKLELADGGSIFLDEIAELPAELQAKLLRVLQEREFERVGGTRPIRVDVRVIAATNRDLRELIKRSEFREDLYYRLDVVSVRMPPLRERRDDIPLLVNYFVSRSAARMGRRMQGVSPEVHDLLARHDWPGNVRELENAIERAVVLSDSDCIHPEDLPEAVLERAIAGCSEAEGYLDAIHRAKQEIILRAIETAGGNQMKAASALRVHHTYLSRLIRSLGLKDKVAGLRGG